MAKNIESEIYKKICEVVHNEWDPIGVSTFPEAYDEYYSYIPGICSLLERGAGEEEMFQHLWLIETEAMGLNGRKDVTEAFAQKLIRLYRTWGK